MSNFNLAERLEQKQSFSNYSVSKLKLTNFRNYEKLELEISNFPVVVTGDNGAGKTNILEAISLLSPGRGIRNAKLSELSNQNTGKPWIINAVVSVGNEEHNIDTGFIESAEDVENSDKRIIKIDHDLIRKSLELSKVFSVLYMVPQMNYVFSAGNTAKRKFLDDLTAVFDKNYHKILNLYEKLLRERRKLLLMSRHDDIWLTSLETSIAEQAVIIAAARKDTVEKINVAIKELEAPFPKAVLFIKGFVEDLLDDFPALQVEEVFRAKLKECRGSDAVSGKTNYGTHRTELTAMHDKKRIIAEHCSTGEQKSLVLSVILGAAKSCIIWFGSAPVLLLDEVIAHFDDKTRHYLLSEVVNSNIQTWMSATTSDFFKDFSSKLQFFAVNNGKLC